MCTLFLSTPPAARCFNQAGYETWLFVRCQGAKESTSQLPRSWNAPVAPGPPSTLRWNKAQQPQKVKPCHPVSIGHVHDRDVACTCVCIYCTYIYIRTYTYIYIYLFFLCDPVSNNNDPPRTTTGICYENKYRVVLPTTSSWCFELPESYDTSWHQCRSSTTIQPH